LKRIRQGEVLVACETLRDELFAAFEQAGGELPVIWLESGLHHTPSKLKRRLEAELDNLGDSVDFEVSRVLLALGNCGNAVHGIESRDYELVVPHVDDCISLLLGSDKHREEVARELAAIYLTAGWMRGERTPVVEYEHAKKRYGEEQAREVLEMMYKHYRTIALLDTGTYPMDALMDETERVSELLGLPRVCIPASCSYLTKLIAGPWDDEAFIVVPPHSRISFL